MIKTTVYLPQTLKRRLAALARAQGRSEAELIREGVERLVREAQRKPLFPLFRSSDGTIAERVDELLAGFGER